MSDRDFQQLSHATRVMSSDTLFFKQVEEWEAKRKSIQVQLSDLPNLVAGHLERSSRPYAPDGRYRLVDAAPTVRLANACEAIANCLYSVAEIAANFANRASKGALPTSFNAIRKKCADFPTSELSAALGDLQWYRKVRELRTEWAHYSSIFIAENKQGEVMLCVRAYRRESDRQEFTGPNFSCTIDQFIEWVRNAIVTLDDFAGFVLKMFVLPRLELDQTFMVPIRDGNGFPKLKADFLFDVETVSMREYLRRGGIAAPDKSPC